MNSRIGRNAGLRASSRQASVPGPVLHLIDNDRKRCTQIIRERKITVN